MTFPLNGRLYTTTREVAAEKATPVVGGTMAAELGNAWADSRVISVSLPPKEGKKLLTITHVRIPSIEEQNQTNWDPAIVDIGGQQLESITRTVVYLRSEYDEADPAIPTLVPDDDEDITAGYTLIKREPARSGSELEPVFIIERRLYVLLAAQGGTDALDDGYIYTTSQNLVPFSSIPDSRGEIGLDGTITEYSVVDTNNAIARTRQLVSPETEYRAVLSKLAPDRFFSAETISVTDAITFNGGGAPTVPSVADQQEVSVTVKGKIKHTVTTVQGGTPAILTGTSLDERTGATFFEPQVAVPVGSVEESSVNEDGVVELFSPFSATFAIKQTRKVASTEVREWDKIVNYEWPPVLIDYSFTYWSQIKGRIVALPDFRFKQGFSGPQVAHVRQWWQLESPTVTSPNQMIPEGAVFNTPLVDFTLPACLHGEIVARCVIGADDPEWDSADYVRVFPPTNFTDWPDTIIWVESNPYNGGYIVTEYTLNKPI